MSCPRSRRVMFVAMIAALPAAPALAQTPTGRITGVVRDASGGGLEAAAVAVTNNATRVTRSTTTAPGGSWTVSALLPID